jgi:hypothetical protein
MIRIIGSPCAAVFAVFTLLGFLPISKADIPGITLNEIIDPSPGVDAYGPGLFKLNHATHRLYAAGISNRNFGIKVIDTTSNVILGGIDLGRYSDSANGFWPLGLDVDESAAPAGDKVYVIGRTDGSVNVALRVIDGPSNTNLTGEGTDLFLPMGVQDFTTVAVNSSNHKIYVARDNDEITVVDGPGRQILRTLRPNFGDFVVASPATNKIFVVNHNGGGVINSADDMFAPLSLFFTATAAVVDSLHGRIYFVGTALNNSNGIFAVDATTGELVGSKTGLAALPVSVTIKPDENTLYVGAGNEVLAFDAADFTPRGSFPRPAAKLAYDPASSAGLFLVDPNEINSVLAMNPATGAVAIDTLGYRPLDVAINSRTNRIYVTDEWNKQLLVIDGSNHTVVSRIPVLLPYSEGVFKRRVAVSERLNRVYLPRTSYNSSTQETTTLVDVFDGGTNQFRGSIALDPTIGFYSDLVAIDDTRRRIYAVASHLVSTYVSERLLVMYDTDTEARIATVSLGINLGYGADGLAANPVTGRVYASIGSVAIVDANANTRIGIVNSVGGQIAVNRRTNKVYVVNTNFGPESNVNVIDGATDSLETSIPLQNGNDYVVTFDVDEVTNRLYFAHASQPPELAGRMTAYDANNGYQFLGQIDLALNPAGIKFNATSRQLYVSHNVDGVISAFQDSVSAPADLFGNISTRAHVGNADDVLIGGFILDGLPSDTKRLMIRALGPSLTQSGVSGALSDTTLEVHDASGNVITNDNWKISDLTSTSQQAEIEATGIPPRDDLESALVMTLPAGQSVTAIVRGKNGTAGVGLVEMYDLDRGLPAKLLNISTRGHVGAGDDVMIAGAIILGSKSVQVVLRAIGPSLVGSGVSNPLEDPVLELRDPNGGLIASNDDWQEHEAEVNATLLAPTDSRESVIVADLFPANYTAIARGKDGSVGVALVEAYYLNR